MTRRGVRPLARLALIAACTMTAGICAPARSDASCYLAITTGVQFGSYDPTAASPLDSVGFLYYFCDGSTHNIRISLTRGSSATFTPRTLRSGAEILEYNLFLDAARTSIWGDGTAGTSLVIRGNPPNWQTRLSIFGRIPAGQDVAAGNYSDQVTVVIDF